MLPESPLILEESGRLPWAEIHEAAVVSMGRCRQREGLFTQSSENCWNPGSLLVEEDEEGCKPEKDTQIVLCMEEKNASKGAESRQVELLQVHPGPMAMPAHLVFIEVWLAVSGKAICVWSSSSSVGENAETNRRVLLKAT